MPDNTTPYHVKQAIDHLNYAELVRKQEGTLMQPNYLLHLADLHAKLAVADAIERAVKAINYANEQRVTPF